ncbi:hypothetical protein GCM10010302_65640 [Streptomyces polychromogenes]|uniref:Uncharacterized protein n=1 Tax=Streptomyces polychromogenes TaxID=67342 RepID=A0ABN0VU59_9ACTN
MGAAARRTIRALRSVPAPALSERGGPAGVARVIPTPDGRIIESASGPFGEGPHTPAVPCGGPASLTVTEGRRCRQGSPASRPARSSGATARRGVSRTTGDAVGRARAERGHERAR